MENQFDLVVIGGGPGGYTAAIKAAKLGLKTALVEERELGGTCLNRGCIPTKAMLHAGRLLRQIKEGGQFGIFTAGAGVDYGRLLEYRRDTVSRLGQGVEQLLKANGVTCFSGKGTLLPGKEVRVAAVGGEVMLTAGNVLLATGSKPRVLSLPGMELSRVLDSDQLLTLEELPQSLVIIGGGAIGVEFAEAFSALGTRVTILETSSRLLPSMDREISQNLRMIFKKRGIEIHTDAELLEIRRGEDGLTCIFREKGQGQAASAQYVLCAVGRAPNMDGLFGKGTAPAMEHGHVAVDETFQTNVEGVYAIVDLIGGAQLAHAASAQGIAVAERLAGKAPSIKMDVVPRCVYVDPEIAVVGLTSDEAKECGIPVRIGKCIMGANGKSLITKAERGFIKVVASTEAEEVLGAHLMCSRGTDMIGELTTAVANRWTVAQLLTAMRAHPTYNEGIGEALTALLKRG